jgi:hypothetical protein
MGFDAIWISPIVQNIAGPSGSAGEAYHGSVVLLLSKVSEKGADTLVGSVGETR